MEVIIKEKLFQNKSDLIFPIFNELDDIYITRNGQNWFEIFSLLSVYLNINCGDSHQAAQLLLPDLEKANYWKKSEFSQSINKWFYIRKEYVDDFIQRILVPFFEKPIYCKPVYGIEMIIYKIKQI